MSASSPPPPPQPPADVTRIQDEDVLRRMWQDTDDFGRKKEIRAHMYRLREARLKEFYNNSSELNATSESHSTTSTTTTSSRISSSSSTAAATTQTNNNNNNKNTSRTTARVETSKPCMPTTHIDSLDDHSFISMKTKEIRDSESPTKDVSYRNVTDKSMDDRNWNVLRSSHTSNDGKTHTTSQLATTAGTEHISNGGQLKYAAKNEQQTTNYQDGDDKNFVKSFGAQSNTFIKQEASGGDDNNSFKTSSTKESFSKVTTEQQRSCNVVNDHNNSKNLMETDTQYSPRQIGDGDVRKETQTLPDGSVVTTTKYATKGGSTVKTVKSTEQQSSNVNVTKSSNTQELKQNLPPEVVDGDVKVSRETRTMPDGSTVTTTKYLTKDGSTVKTVRNIEQHSSNIQQDLNQNLPRELTDGDVRVTKETRTTPDGGTVTTTTKYVTQSAKNIDQHSSNVNVTKLSNNRDSNIVRYIEKTQPIDIEVNVVPLKTVTQEVVTTSQKRFEPKITTTITRDVNAADVVDESRNHSTSTTTSTKISDAKDQKVVEPYQAPQDKPHYPSCQRTEPATPPKSELNQKLPPTDGQYQTTYRTDYTNKRISQDVSPTHDAFARSLRAVSPDRITKRPSQSSLRSSTSPEKFRHPSRLSPDRRSPSPRKPTNQFSSTETITYRNRTDSSSTITKKSKTNDIDSSTLTRKTKVTKQKSPSPTTEVDSNTLTRKPKNTRPRSPSPTSITSDIEYIRASDLVTDLDTNETIRINRDRPTSPAKLSDSPKHHKKIDTYEERCRQILGLTNETTTKRRGSMEKITRKEVSRTSHTSPIEVNRSPEKKSPIKEPSPKRGSPVKDKPKVVDTRKTIVETRNVEEIRRTDQISGPEGRSPSKEPTPHRGSPVKDKPKEPTTPKRSSPVKESKPRNGSPTKRKPDVEEIHTITTKIRNTEATCEIEQQQSPDRKSPSKEPTPRYGSPVKDKPKVEETRRTTVETTNIEEIRDTDSVRSPERKSPTKQLSPQKTPLEQNITVEITESDSVDVEMRRQQTENYEQTEIYEFQDKPQQSPKIIAEFPSQIRKSPEQQPPTCESPSQIRRAPEEEKPLDTTPGTRRSPERKSPPKGFSEFPSQMSKSPERISLDSLPDRHHPVKARESPEREITRKSPQISEFPSQIRRSPERQRPYDEMTTITCEVSSPVRKSPEKDVIRKSPIQNIREFPKGLPEQQRPTDKSPETKRYPARKSPEKETGEFPPLIRKSPEKQFPSDTIPETKRQSPKEIDEFPSQIRKSPEKPGPIHDTPETRKSPERKVPEKEILEFPSQVRKVSEKQRPTYETSETRRSPDRKSPVKQISEFPSQIRKSPEKITLDSLPDRSRPISETPKISEFPAQIRRSPEKELSDFSPKTRKSPERISLGSLPDEKRPVGQSKTICDYPTQARKVPGGESPTRSPERMLNKESPRESGKLPERESRLSSRKSPERQMPRKSPGRIPVDESLERPKLVKESPKTSEHPPHARKSPDKTPLDRRSEKTKPKDTPSKIKEYPSHVRKLSEKPPEKQRPTKQGPKVSEYPSQIRRVPEKQPLEKLPEKQRPTKQSPKISEFPSQVRRVPEKQSLEKLPEKQRPAKESPKIAEFPSQIRKPKERLPLYKPAEKPQHQKVAPKITEFPSHTRKSPDKIRPFDKKVPNGIGPKKPSEAKSPEKQYICTVSIENRKNRRNDYEISLKNKPKGKKPATGTSSESSTSEEEDNVEEEVTTVDYAESSEEGRDEDEQRRDIVKKTETKTTRKDVSRDFIEKEILDNKLRNKKPEQPRRTEVNKVTKTLDAVKKTTLYDVDKLDETDNRIHIRTHRIDDTIRTTPSKSPMKSLRPETKKPSEQEAPKRHVVSTTITVTSPTTRKPQMNKTVKKTQKLTNGHTVSDTENEEINKTQRRNVVVTRTTNDQIPTRHAKTPTRSGSKPELTSSPMPKTPKSRPEKKCITTKSIIINNNDTVVDRREVIVDLQRSKSSREPTPDQLCPLPVTSDDETSPRYPDEITEPEDDSLKRRPKKLSDIPILESETTETFSRITEITDDVIIEESDKKDECLLSVSEKVKKFINTAEQLTVPQQPERPKSPKFQNYTDDQVCVSDKVTHFIKTAEQVVQPQVKDNPECPRRDSIKIDKTLKEDECLLSVSDKVTKFTTKIDDSSKPVSLSKIDFLPKSSPTKKTAPDCPQIETEEQMDKKIPQSDTTTPKSILSPTSRLRSTETVKKAREMFETHDQSRPKTHDSQNRPSIDKNRTQSPCVVRKLDYNEDDDTLKSTRLVMAKSRSKSPEKHEFPDVTEDTPGYMRPLDRSLRPNSPHRESISQLGKKQEITDVTEAKTSKFGVTLKRVDSNKTQKTATVETEKTVKITEEEIEEIYDLVVLEQLLEKVVGYDLRRKIRAQIRIVKQLHAENRIEVVAKKTEDKKTATTQRRSKTPEKTLTKKTLVTKTTTAKDDDAPEWTKQRNLKKVSERTTISRSSATTTATTTTTTKSRSSPVKEPKPTDIITSSYGIGPTDDNGVPLFGLKALRSQKTDKKDTIKIQGTVIKSEYYAENDQEPIGEITVTKYSNEPNESNRNDQITSVTTTQKFGYKDTPSLKQITGKKTTNKIDNEKTKQITRRNSVKALSQKFTETHSETSSKQDTKQTSSYPKAGLILRTSSFKLPKAEEKTVETSSNSCSFLSNHSKITGIQDVITRMETEEVQDGDTVEDIEARGLLNKFLGSQVILSGLEAATASSTTNNKTTLKITITTTVNGKQTTKTLVFQRPITEDDLADITDEQILQFLLEQSSEYEERRVIRNRLRLIMAEQEGAQVVDKSNRDLSTETTTTIDDAFQMKKSEEAAKTEESKTITTKFCVNQQQQQQQVGKKPLSPFAKFRQLDKQNSLNTPPRTSN